MKSNIDIEPQHLELVLKILHKYLDGRMTQVWVFGSRAKGDAKKYSDLDLAINAGQALTLACILDLEIAFEESDLPYKVDIVDWLNIEDSFKKIIDESKIELIGSTIA